MAINLAFMRDLGDMPYFNNVEAITKYIFIVCVSHSIESLSEEFKDNA